MIIFVEGIDNSGKTSLIKNLQETLIRKNQKVIILKNPIKIEKGGNPEIIKGVYAALLYFAELIEKEYWVIFDRGFFTELVYAPILRSYTPNNEHFWQLKLEEYRKKVIVLYCNPGLDILIKRYQELNDSYIGEKDIKSLYIQYSNVLKESKYKIILVKTEGSINYDNLIKQINNEYLKDQD